MKKYILFLLVFGAMLTYSIAASAQVVDKTKKGVEKGVEGAEKGVTTGAEATEKGVNKAADATEKV